MTRRFTVYAATIGILASMIALGSTPAHATFHLMQVEQVIGGVSGDTTAQAVQLRMRVKGQGGVSRARLVVRDANGRNPVTLIDFATDITPEVQGERILIATSGFAAHTNPAVVPDFVMVNRIPDSFLAAGSLTYETDRGLVLWRLSWGGAAYKGSNKGLPSNDDDGDFGPAFPDALPSTATDAVLFQGAAKAKSTTNASDYAVTPGAATFTNSSGENFVVTP
jgi:hypothetical protein